MKKLIAILISLLILVLLPASLLAAQKAQKTITSYTYSTNANAGSASGASSSTTNKSFGVTKLGKGGTGTTASTTNNDGSSAMAAVATTTPAATVDTNSGSITLINSESNSSGAIWYAGTTSSSTTVCNACSNGVCPFGFGFRAYFEFKTSYADTSARSDVAGDGFTFAVMNSTNNTKTDRGGLPSNSSMGALLGYAGPGDTSSGIEPPKFAVEFDLYPNNTSETNFCSSGRYDNAGSYDYYGSSGNTSNHIALMFWGRNITGSCRINGTYYSQASFDDNYHGAGDGSTSYPYNSSLSGNGSGLGGYYERSRSANGNGTYNWMEDQVWHRVRIEVIRTPSSYSYQVRTWVDCETASGSSTCPASEYVDFQDLYSAYSNASYLPKIDRTVILSPTYSGNLDNILFGFTEGSGLVTQSITIANFAIYFPTTVINPTSATFSTGASTTGTVTVTATKSTCVWTAISKNTSWLTVSGYTGTGSGTVSYSLTANTTGESRTGTIIIGDNTFTVTQAACAYSLGSSSASYTASAYTGRTVSVATTSGCTWSAVSNNAWITVTGGSSGTGNGTVTYSVAGNTTGTARTGTISIAGNTFTVTQAGCIYTLGSSSASYTASAYTSRTVSVTTTSTCTWTAVSNNSWITVTGGSSGTGNGTVTYSIAANTGIARTGTMTIAGNTFTVTQASGCSYSISPTAATYNCSGGSGSISVTASDSACTWTASDNSNWITTNTTSGTGSGTVSYTVNSRTCSPGSSRTGTITVTGNGSSYTCTITQTRP
jgi:hypothetical protein